MQHPCFNKAIGYGALCGPCVGWRQLVKKCVRQKVGKEDHRLAKQCLFA